MFVHGVGPPRQVDKELRSWTSALAVGAAQAGHASFAERLLSGAVPVQYVHYGDLFRADGQQGDDGAYPEETAQLLSRLLLDLIDDQLEQTGDGEIRDILQEARADLEPCGREQGVLAPIRRSVNAATTLLSLPGLRAAGQWLSGRLLVRDLGQVARYLRRGEADAGGRTLDVRIRQRVHDALAGGPVVLVAHSLGSIVAWEALHEHPGSVPLLVTLGSPLAMRTVVWPLLVPRPPATPAGVDQWVNIWDRDDIITARPLLEREILPNARGVRPVSSEVTSAGIWVHTATKYLSRKELAGRVAEGVEAR